MKQEAFRRRLNVLLFIFLAIPHFPGPAVTTLKMSSWPQHTKDGHHWKRANKVNVKMKSEPGNLLKLQREAACRIANAAKEVTKNLWTYG